VKLVHCLSCFILHDLSYNVRESVYEELNFCVAVPLKPVIWGVRDVARIHYPSCTDSIKPSLQLSCNFVVTNVKSFPEIHFSIVIYFGPSGLLMPALFSVENWVPLKPVLGYVRDVAHIHYPSCTDSIKPGLQLSCNFVVINASEGSLCFQSLIRIDVDFNALRH
jgi:hypothetical protein